eukprot:273844-Rhodomonas_salina.1
MATMPFRHAGLVLPLAVALSLASTSQAFQASLSLQHKRQGRDVFFSRAATFQQRPASSTWRREKASLTMQEQTSKHKKIYPGRPPEPDMEEGVLLSSIAMSDQYKEDSRMYRRTVFDPEDWCVKSPFRATLLVRLTTFTVLVSLRGFVFEACPACPDCLARASARKR